MDRNWWIAARAYGPAVGLLVLAVLVGIPILGLKGGCYTAGYFEVMRWLPVGLAGLGLLAGAVAIYRLWQWEVGAGPQCIACSGPLGAERDGRQNRGGAYRRCYACGKAVNHRHYE